MIRGMRNTPIKAYRMSPRDSEIGIAQCLTLKCLRSVPERAEIIKS
jgi:hypothetical protein